MKTISSSLLALAFLAAVPATRAAEAQDHQGHHGPAAAASEAAEAFTEGEVRKIDKDNGRITLKHGEIRNLGMPPMTMVFRVRDAALLDSVQTGDKVRFLAEQENGVLVLTRLQLRQ